MIIQDENWNLKQVNYVKNDNYRLNRSTKYNGQPPRENYNQHKRDNYLITGGNPDERLRNVGNTRRLLTYPPSVGDPCDYTYKQFMVSAFTKDPNRCVL